MELNRRFLLFAKRLWLLVLSWTNGRRTARISADQRESVSSVADQREPEPEPDPAPDVPITPVIYKPAPWRKVGRFKFNRPPRPKPKPREKPVEPEEKKIPTSPAPLVVREEFVDPVETGRFNPNAEGIQECYGRFYFRDTILDQLDTYFTYLRRLKRSDREAFALFSKTGAQIAPYGLNLFVDPHLDAGILKERQLRLEAWWKVNRPGFGAIVYGANPLGEEHEQIGTEDIIKEKGPDWSIFVPKFLYFSKYSRPPVEFQPAPGTDVYKLTIYWDKPGDKKFVKHHKGGVPQDYGVSIDTAGKVRVLLTLCSETVKFVSRQGPREYRGVNTFQRQRWRIPEQFTEWADDRGISANLLLHNIFIDAVHRWLHTHSGVQINVRKGDLAAVFSLDAERVPYFFQDRDITINNHGKRARVFHLVRAHMRETKKGPVPVKISCRGERHFAWNGYDILITIPGKHHHPIVEWNVGAQDERQLEENVKNWLSSDQIGEMWAQHFHGEPLREATKSVLRSWAAAAPDA